jgi:cytochrome P450
MCLGLHLARMETKVALTQLFDRLPGLRFDPEIEPVPISGAIFRAPAALNITWD